MKKVKEKKVVEKSQQINISTKIWKEIPIKENPYLVSECLCHGYNMEELYQNMDYISMIYLLFTGELPNKTNKELLSTLMIGCINKGPRDVGVRSSIIAAQSGSVYQNLYPIGLNMSSNHSIVVFNTMNFIESNFQNTKKENFETGFVNNEFGENKYYNTLADHIQNKFKGETFTKVMEYVKSNNLSFTAESIAASVFLDLGIDKRMAIGIWGFIISPGIIAHAFENPKLKMKELTFIDDSNYHIKGVDEKYDNIYNELFDKDINN